MAERDFEIGGRKFKLNKIDTFKQFHIVRRLAPILGDIIPIAQKLHKLQKENMTEDEMLESVVQLSGPIMAGISSLSDQDANLVLLGLCSSVEVQQMPTGNWAFVARDAGLMIQDLELPVLLQIAGRAFAYNLAGFFNSMPQTTHGQALTSKGK
jgi:hypothetical protein